MIRQVLGLTALFGLGAQAFMIPSTMSLPDFEDRHLPEFSDLIPSFHAETGDPESVHVEDSNAFVHSILETTTVVPLADYPDSHVPVRHWLVKNVDCPTCVVSSKIALSFKIDNSGEQLLLNDVPLFPLGEIAPTFTAHEQTVQIIHDASTPAHHLNYQAAIVAGTPSPMTGDEIFDIWYKLTAIDDVETSTEPIKVKLAKTTNGRLTILRITIDSDMPNEFLKPQEEAQETCNGPAFFCKLFNIFETKISAWRSKMHSSKPCHGFKGQNLEDITLPTLHGGIPKFTLPPMDTSIINAEELRPDNFHFHHGYHGYHHHEHHHHERLHAFVQGVRDFLVGFLIPVLIGIMAGMFASLVGMVLGSFVAWAWIRFVRKGKRGPCSSVSASEGSAEDSAEKSALLSNEQNAERQSEDSSPPAYVEKA